MPPVVVMVVIGLCAVYLAAYAYRADFLNDMLQVFQGPIEWEVRVLNSPSFSPVLAIGASLMIFLIVLPTFRDLHKETSRMLTEHRIGFGKGTRGQMKDRAIKKFASFEIVNIRIAWAGMTVLPIYGSFFYSYDVSETAFILNLFLDMFDLISLDGLFGAIPSPSWVRSNPMSGLVGMLGAVIALRASTRAFVVSVVRESDRVVRERNGIEFLRGLSEEDRVGMKKHLELKKCPDCKVIARAL